MVRFDNTRANSVMGKKTSGCSTDATDAARRFSSLLTELDERVFVFLDEAVEVVLIKHVDTLVDLDCGQANRNEAECR